MREKRPPVDAVLVVSFGGPEGPEQVIPFLEHVLEGKNVPRARMLEVAEHYQHFGGFSPINEQNRALIQALRSILQQKGPMLPVYWGNRNWHPFLRATLEEMSRAGIERALAFVTSAYSSYSSCRQYLEDIEKAREEVGPAAPEVDKLRTFYNHPDFIAVNAENLRMAYRKISPERRQVAPLVFTAHSLPMEMAGKCTYERQLVETCRLVSESVSCDHWQLAYQSRSGPPHQPWLEPDVRECLKALKDRGSRDVVVSPIGFISDHLEVLYDLDTEARHYSEELGLNMVRAATPGTHPQFVGMIRELVLERILEYPERRSLGKYGPGHDLCPVGCCPAR